MAVRPTHSHDGGIVERRLRPIYDWLDNGNNKKALQEIEKVLKKSPSLQAARALKALALFRLGKNSEAQAVLDALVEEKPSDDSTLQAMTISYRESQQLPKVCTLYEAAVKAEPQNEELHTHLFMSYVRIGDHRAQQRSAMALYKFVPKNPYYFWAVMSIVLQAKSAEDPKQRGILLALAQRMVENFITENKLEAEQEVRLYIMILELQEKWDDILKFIETPLYEKLVPGSNAQACIPYLIKLGHWRRLNILCKDLLYDNQDRWDYYMTYFDSVFQLMKKPDDSGESSENLVDDTAEKCHEFICQIVESMSAGRVLRGPYLARLELWKRLSVDGDPTSLLGDGVALCVQYLRVFAHKPCAVPDLRQYLAMIPQKEREDKCMEFLTCLGFDENSEPDNMDDIQRHISCVSAWRLTAPPLPPEGSSALAATLRKHYLRCLGNGLVTATATEFGAADGYGILAAHHYFYAAMQLKSAAPIIEALSLLELVLENSASNFHAKLLLIKLYHLLGNALAADTIYQKLEVKHIQLVSLGWLHAARLAPGCVPSRALQLLADTRAFHSHHAKDSVEHLTYAYKYGTFEKLVELVAWSARVAACAWCAAASRSHATLALLAGPPPLHAPPHHSSASDNRDLNVIVNYEPAQFHDPKLKERTFEQDVAYLRLKDGLVSAVVLCLEAAENRPIEAKMCQYRELQTCVSAFSTAMEKCRELYCEPERICIATPFPSTIIAFVNSPVPYRELYSSTLLMVGEFCVGHLEAAHAQCSQVTELVRDARTRAAAPRDLGVWGLRERLEHLHNYLEDMCQMYGIAGERCALQHGLVRDLAQGTDTQDGPHTELFIGIITFLLGVCNEINTPNNAKKSKKKANQSPEQLKTGELLRTLNETVQENIAALEKIFDELPEYQNSSTLEEEFANLNLENRYANVVDSKLKAGRLDMISDVKNVLKNKTKYLKSLIQ